MNIIKKVPIPISGLILAILSLGNLLQVYSPNFKVLCGVIGFVLIFMLIFKVILYPHDVLNDLSNPIILSNSGTFSMALMISSTYISLFDGTLALGVWILGVALHILLIMYFTYRYVIRNFDIKVVYPSWWIVFIGITMGAITAHVHGLFEIAYLFFIFGFISMIITLPLVVYRYIKYPNKLDQNKPLICIFTAIFSILIVGYTNSFSSLSYDFLMVMYSIAFALFIFALFKVIEYKGMEFYPSFSAFTFPFVITSIASSEVYMFNQNFIIHIIMIFQTGIACILVIYVLYKYLRFLLD